MKGTIHKIFPTEQKTEKFKKREFVLHVVETNGSREFDNWIKFQLNNDKCNMLDHFTEGQEVEVFYNVRGVKWDKNDGTTAYFTNLECWKMVAESQAQPVQPIAQTENKSFDDSLPF